MPTEDDIDAAAAAAGGDSAAGSADTAENTGADAPNDDTFGDESLEAIYDKIAADFEAEETDTPAAPDKAAVADPKTDQPPKAEGAPAGPASPPNSWSADMKGKWATIPPDAQAYIAQRETEAHDQISRMGQEVARSRPLTELIDARQGIFDQHGLDAHEGLSLLLDAQELLDQDPLHGIAAIADKYGIDLAATFGTGQRQQTQGGAVDPQVTQRLTQLEHQNRTLQQQLTLRDNTARSVAERETLARREEAKTTVATWSEGKTHFAREDVKKLMGTLLGNKSANDLDDAYDQACHAIPEVRTLVTADASRKTLAEQARAASDAKRNRGVNAGARPGKPAKTGSWDDDSALEATFDRIVGG